MAKPKLPSTKDWENREVADWNTTTFQCYLIHLHQKYYNLPYIPFKGGWIAEKKLIKADYEQFGKQAVKEMIDAAFNEYKPSPSYPNLSYGFIYSYMKGRLLPKILKAKQEQEKVQARKILTKQEPQQGLEEWI